MYIHHTFRVSFNYKKRIDIHYGDVMNEKVISKCSFGHIVGTQFFFLLFRAPPVAYGGSQAKG